MIPRICFFLLTVFAVAGAESLAGNYIFSVRGEEVLLNGKPFKVVGLRCSNALISDGTAQELIDQLDIYKAHGVNTVSVFFMGSRFGDVKGYQPDGTLESTYARRMGRIIEATDDRGMMVLVGCLYWSTSKAKEELEGWTQTEANKAVANTIAWLSRNDYRNVFVDVDNEGMAHDAKGWSIESMIEAAHAVDGSIMVAYNDGDAPPKNADLYIHHSPKVQGKPWLDSEATPKTPGGYWGRYSKETHLESRGRYYNYSRIGRYTESMKEDQLRRTREEVRQYTGHMIASTWLQCPPSESVGGPFARPGGNSKIADVNEEIDVLHEDAGIQWWLNFTKEEYGPWTPPQKLKRSD